MQLSAKSFSSIGVLVALMGCAAATAVIEPVAPESAPPTAAPVTKPEQFAQAYRMMREGKDEPALGVFADLSRDYPQLADYHLYFTGYIQARRGSLEASEAALTRLLAEYPQSVKAAAASLELGKLLLRQGQYEASATFLERAVSAPEPPVRDAARLALAEVDERRGRIPAAYAALMSVRRDARGKPAAREAKKAVLALRTGHRQLTPAGSELFSEAQLLLDERDYAAAEAAVARLRKEQPSTVDAVALTRLEAETLLGRGRLDEGLAALWRVADDYPRNSAAPAALFRLASLLWNRDRDAAAMRAFDELRRRYPNDTRVPDAMYAAARIHQSAGREREAIEAYEAVIRSHPRHDLAAESKWRIGWIHYSARRWEEAAVVFAELAEATSGKRRDEAMYWRARSHDKAGRADRARQLYRQIVAGGDGGPYAAYYAAWAEERIAAMSRRGAQPAPFAFRPGETVVVPPRPEPVAPASVPAFHLERWRELRAAGVNDLAREELAAIERDRADDGATSRFLVDAYQTVDGFGRARALASRLGGPVATQRQLLYPLAFWAEVSAESSQRRLDPLWVVSIMRQESMFDPEARSPADARGLMQLLPSTAERVASAIQIEREGEIDLNQPPVNIQLGTAYLRTLIDRFDGEPLKAVAAYNGGEAAVDRWELQFGALAADEFVESITYRETRDYVKRVAGNYRVYREIYVDSGS